LNAVASPAHLDASASFSLTLSCPSAAGQVAAMIQFLDQRQCYIDELSVYDDKIEGRFFVRCIFHGVGVNPLSLTELRQDFAAVADKHQMLWKIHSSDERMRVVIMVSGLDHCLADLLFRWRMQELPMDIVAIISNHDTLAPLALAHGIPFHHWPITPTTKAQQEDRLLSLVEEKNIDLIVLARYMQILSSAASRRLQNKAINIHHSFLPGFKGARPYQQAFERGVKLIGATAHFVTEDLDEGPIIEQMVDRVTHEHSAQQLQTVGRDMECQALARAVKAFIEQRVFVSGQRTILL